MKHFVRPFVYSRWKRVFFATDIQPGLAEGVDVMERKRIWMKTCLGLVIAGISCANPMYTQGSGPSLTPLNLNAMPDGRVQPGFNSGPMSGPIMGNINPASMGLDPSLADPQMGLLDPVAVMGPGIDPGMSVNLNADAPGITNPFSIRSLVDNANSQVSPAEFNALQTAVQAYVDGNMSDARRLFTDVTQRYSEGVATDRAYLGISKIERAYGAYDVSRRILEAVIRKNRDYESIMLARRAYRDLSQEVMRATALSKGDSEAAYATYKQTSWWNVFSKIRAYNDYKDAKANYEGLMVSTMQFDPIFSQVNISTPIPEGNVATSNQAQEIPGTVEEQINETLSIDEVKKAFQTTLPPQQNQPSYLQPTGGTTVQTNDASSTPESQPAPLVTPAVEIPSDAPAVSIPKPVETMSMDEARAHYLDVYNKLKVALKGSDNDLKKKLQNEYRAALNRYNQLRNQ